MQTVNFLTKQHFSVSLLFTCITCTIKLWLWYAIFHLNEHAITGGVQCTQCAVYTGQVYYFQPYSLEQSAASQCSRPCLSTPSNVYMHVAHPYHPQGNKQNICCGKQKNGATDAANDYFFIWNFPSSRDFVAGLRKLLCGPHAARRPRVWDPAVDYCKCL